MRIEIVRIVYPIEYAAAKEYLEEYLKFIGCIVVEYPVLSKDENEWKLLPIQDDRVFDVFLGYTQEADPYHVDCARLNIRRTYMGESVKSKSNFVIQHDDICNLFSQINDELFQKITYDTMFYYLQARRNLEVLAMAEGRVAESNFCGTPLLQTNQEKNGGIASKSNQPKPKKV